MERDWDDERMDGWMEKKISTVRGTMNGFPNKRTSEQRSGGSEGASNRCVWRREFQEDEMAGRKTMQSVCAWHD